MMLVPKLTLLDQERLTIELDHLRPRGVDGAPYLAHHPADHLVLTFVTSLVGKRHCTAPSSVPTTVRTAISPLFKIPLSSDLPRQTTWLQRAWLRRSGVGVPRVFTSFTPDSERANGQTN